jgi:hypothetical protein
MKLKFAAIPGLLMALVVVTPIALAATTQSYAISAADVTMPASGNGSSTYTVLATPFEGTLDVTCQYSGPATTAKIPYCAVCRLACAPVNVTADETVTGTMYFYPPSDAVPAALPKQRHGSRPGSALLFSGILLAGLGLRRRLRRWPVALLVAVAALALITSVTACGGGNGFGGMTPGTYNYTISAADNGALTPLGRSVSTTISLTVP